MKKLLSLMIVLFVALSTFAQERTVTKTLGDGKYYYKYTGTAADTLKPTNQDTIDFVFIYTEVEFVKKIAIKVRYDVIAGADTTVTYSLFGKEFSDDGTYVQIIAAAAGTAVTANNTTDIITSDYTETVGSVTDTFNADSTTTVAARTVTPLDKTYRYYRLRLILTGNDSVGTGVKIDEIEFKLYVD